MAAGGAFSVVMPAVSSVAVPRFVASCRCRHQVSYSDQGAYRRAEGEHPTDPVSALVPCLAHRPDHLHPAEDIHDTLPIPLADLVARVPLRAAVDGRQGSSSTR